MLLLAGGGAALAAVALMFASVAVALRWWQPRWALPASGVFAVCMLRVVVATINF